MAIRISGTTNDITINGASVATDAEVTSAVASGIATKANTADVNTQLALKSNINSPAFTGTPIAPTQTAGDSSTKIATTAFATSQDLGVNQTWQDVTASRSAGVTYTNNTGKPIEVSVYVANTTNSTQTMIFFYINGLLVSGNGFPGTGFPANNIFAGTVMVIPNNATYKFELSNATLRNVFELR